MDDSLVEFYRVLNRFPFSITGYHYPEREYERSFRDFCEYLKFIKATDKLGFVVSGFAQLDSVLNNYEELLEWKTKPLSNFLFQDLLHRLPEPILSLYITCLEKYSPAKRVVNILAGNVRSEISIQVKVESKETVDFSCPSDTELIITVPSKLFKIERGTVDVFTDVHTTDPMVASQNGSTAYGVRRTDDEHYAMTLATVLDFNQAVHFQSTFSHTSSLKVAKAFNKSSVNVNELFSFIYASALLCWFYDSSLTYFVSTARQAGKERFTLGAMGLGVRSSSDLTSGERAMCHLFVNHVAANLSTRIVYDAYKDIVREKNREEMIMALEGFRAIGESGAHHGELKWSDENAAQIANWIDLQESILSPYFKRRFNQIKEQNEGIVSKYCLSALRKLSGKCDHCAIQKYQSIFSAQLDACCLMVANHSYFNVPFIEALFAQFTKPRNGNMATPCAYASGDDIVLDIEYSDGFDLSGFIKALKSPSRGSSLVATFFGTYYPLLDCHGVLDVSVPVDGKDISVFNSRGSVLRSGETGLILDNNFKFPTGLPEKTKSLRLRFTNELSDRS